MHTVRRAVVDIGTNSVKILVADVTGRQAHPIEEASHQTRLGRGFYETHRLQVEPITETAQAVAEFAAKARRLGAEDVSVIATSAVRDAVNAEDLIRAIAAKAGLNVEVLSGEMEAELAFQGVAGEPRWTGRPLLLLEAGGGSTQFTLGRDKEKQFVGSYPIGSVRLLEEMPPGDPPEIAQLETARRRIENLLGNVVRPQLAPALMRLAAASEAGARALEPSVPRACQVPLERPSLTGNLGAARLVMTGGTAAILARIEARLDHYDRIRIEATKLRIEDVRRQLQELWSMPLVRRRELRGLPPSRADVILYGVAICECVMTEFGFEELSVSTRGLRFGAVLRGVGDHLC